MTYEYENTRRIFYGDDGACFVPVCIKCGRYVKPDKEIQVNALGLLAHLKNATCSKCGRTEMLFEGFVEAI